MNLLNDIFDLFQERTSALNIFILLAVVTTIYNIFQTARKAISKDLKSKTSSKREKSLFNWSFINDKGMLYSIIRVKIHFIPFAYFFLFLPLYILAPILYFFGYHPGIHSIMYSLSVIIILIIFANYLLNQYKVLSNLSQVNFGSSNQKHETSYIHISDLPQPSPHFQEILNKLDQPDLRKKYKQIVLELSISEKWLRAKIFLMPTFVIGIPLFVSLYWNDYSDKKWLVLCLFLYGYLLVSLILKKWIIPVFSKSMSSDTTQESTKLSIIQHFHSFSTDYPKNVYFHLQKIQIFQDRILKEFQNASDLFQSSIWIHKSNTLLGKTKIKSFASENQFQDFNNTTHLIVHNFFSIHSHHCNTTFYTFNSDLLNSSMRSGIFFEFQLNTDSDETKKVVIQFLQKVFPHYPIQNATYCQVNQYQMYYLPDLHLDPLFEDPYSCRVSALNLQLLYEIESIHASHSNENTTSVDLFDVRFKFALNQSNSERLQQANSGLMVYAFPFRILSKHSIGKNYFSNDQLCQFLCIYSEKKLQWHIHQYFIPKPKVDLRYQKLENGQIVQPLPPLVDRFIQTLTIPFHFHHKGTIQVGHKSMKMNALQKVIQQNNLLNSDSHKNLIQVQFENETALLTYTFRFEKFLSNMIRSLFTNGIIHKNWYIEIEEEAIHICYEIFEKSPLNLQVISNNKSNVSDAMNAFNHLYSAVSPLPDALDS